MMTLQEAMTNARAYSVSRKVDDVLVYQTTKVEDSIDRAWERHAP